MGPWVTRVMIFLPANFQTAMSFHSWLHCRYGTDRKTAAINALCLRQFATLIHKLLGLFQWPLHPVFGLFGFSRAKAFSGTFPVCIKPHFVITMAQHVTRATRHTHPICCWFSDPDHDRDPGQEAHHSPTVNSLLTRSQNSPSRKHWNPSTAFWVILLGPDTDTQTNSPTLSDVKQWYWLSAK